MSSGITGHPFRLPFRTAFLPMILIAWAMSGCSSAGPQADEFARNNPDYYSVQPTTQPDAFDGQGLILEIADYESHTQFERAAIDPKIPRHILLRHELPRWEGKHYKSKTTTEDSELTLEFRDSNWKPGYLSAQVDFNYSWQLGALRVGPHALTPAGNKKFDDMSPSTLVWSSMFAFREGQTMVIAAEDFGQHDGIVRVFTIYLSPRPAK